MTLENRLNNLPIACSEFFAKLQNNNNKAWFEKNRDEYEQNILEPGRLFVELMAERLYTLSPDIIADPRINQSIFRLFRDTRFSKDKTPYKTHFGIFFWEGDRKKLENPGFYVHFEPGKSFVAVGQHMFPRDTLAVYREKLEEPSWNKSLMKAVKKVEANGYQIKGKHYKRFPRGSDETIPNAEYLLYNGIYGYFETDDLSALSGPDFVDTIFSIFAGMYPIHQWMVELEKLV